VKLMNKTKLLVVGVLAGVLIASAGGAAAWWGLRATQPGTGGEPRPVAEKHPPKYVSLEKVIVMLRRASGDPMSHYLAVDLVFKTFDKQEKVTREHLPMLRSVAVRALSTLTPAQAGSMSIDQLAEEVKRAYSESYAAEQREQPFSDVMIGKLIIE
jgi:flagellar protein FliL